MLARRRRKECSRFSTQLCNSTLVFAFTSFGAQYAFDWRLLRPPPMELHHTMILNFRCNWLL